MSFSARVKNEIIDKGIQGEMQKKAFLSGFIRATSSIIEQDGEYGFEFSVESAKTAEFILYLLKSTYSYVPKETYLTGQRIVSTCVGNGAMDILDDLGIITVSEQDFSLNVKLDCFANNENVKKSFVKGVFVGSGNVTIPNKREEKKASTGYHLEFLFFGYEQALEFSSFLAEMDFFTKLINRKENYVIYVKSSEEIKDFLALLGAPKAVLEITDIMIEKEIMSNTNRRTNCDLANVNKQMNASEKSIETINSINKTVGLDSLPETLKMTAIARREFADDTLSELAERLNITKSCLNHRLRKLSEIDKNLR